MIRFVFRLIGFLALAAAFVAVVYDGTRSIAADHIELTALQQVWSVWHPASFAALQPAMARMFAGWVWDPVMVTLLSSPAWAIFAVVGCVLLLAGRRKRPLIGYART